MADPKIELNKGDKLQKVRIELSESSGPVSPRFQYEVHVLVEGDGGGLTLTYDEDGANEVAIKRAFAREELDTLWEKLVAAGALDLGATLGAETRAKVGASFNSLDINAGSETKVHMEYTVNGLKRPEEASRRKVIELVKALKEGAPAKGAKEAAPAKEAKEAAPAKEAKEAAPAKEAKEAAPAKGAKRATPAKGAKGATPAKGGKARG